MHFIRFVSIQIAIYSIHLIINIEERNIGADRKKILGKQNVGIFLKACDIEL